MGFLGVLLSVELSESPGDADQLQERYFVCEARTVFPHVHHFVPLCHFIAPRLSLVRSFYGSLLPALLFVSVIL